MKLSIITITYKDPKGLAETAKSLLPILDSKIDFEHVVVDSSPEDNHSVFKGLPENWPLVHIEMPAAGIYPALNRGLRASSGELLWFLNGGDQLRDVTVLQKSLDLFREQATDLVIAGSDRYRDGLMLYTIRPHSQWVSDFVGTNRICHQAVVYRAAVFSKLGGFSEEYQLAADYEHYFRCFAAGMKAVTMGDSLVIYDMSGKSSDYVQAYDEFRRIQTAYRSELPLRMNAANRIFWFKSRAEISLIKCLSRSPLRKILHPVWLAWKRKRLN